jgi:hypothetical protein
MIIDDFKAYTNAMGFVSNSPGGSSGNDLLISAEAKRILIQNNAWTDAMQHALEDAIEDHSYLNSGVYARPGWQQDQEQADDYYGLCYMDILAADSVLHYGRDNWWYFKTSPNAKWYEPMFWRWPALIAHAKWAVDSKKPNPLLRLYWGMSIMSADYTQQDSCKINRLLVEVAGDKGWWERFVTKMFWKKLKKTYGTMKAVYQAYYGDTHPITTWCKD